LTEEQQNGTVPPEAAASTKDREPDRAAVATAVASEPETTAPPEASAVTDTPATDEVALDADSAVEAAAEPGPTAADPEESSQPAASAVADADPKSSDDAQGAAASDLDEAQPVETDAAAATSAPSTLEDDDTADAPAAVDEEPEEVAPAPRDLGPEPTTMEELLAEQDSDIKSFKHGDVVEGTVVRIDKDEILVDIGAKSEGVVSNRELYGRHAESQPQLAIGDVVLVYVLQPESQEGHAVLSLRRAGLERKWRSMQEQFEAGVIIEAPVIDHNKGGLIVDCGIRGFVPISQIVDFPRRPQNDQPRDAAQEIAEKLMPFVGRKLRLKILEVNRKANRLILSEKVALYEERREKRDELFSSLQVGQKVTGTVRSIAPFGVFIDLGGIDGLVHKSELSWNKVNNPESGYKVGEEVEAEVIDINHERGRISLSIRRLQPDPWHSTVADFKVGDVIDGTVTKLVNFGAFVRVRDGLEGLIHISELSHQRVAHPGDVVHEGQTLKLKIISLDSERHRLGLSLKQAEEAPARPAPEPGQAAPRAAAGERRPRPERGWSASDAVQEPEGGIDNTLAAAFAQVRDQLAASEETTEPAAAETTAAPSEPEAVAETATEPEAEVVAEAATEPEAEAAAETAAEPEPEAVAETAAEPEPEAVAETAAEPEPEAVAGPEAEAVAEGPAESEPEAVAETAVEPEPEVVAETAAEPEPEAVAGPEAEAVAEAPAESEPEAVAETAAEPEPEAVAEAAVEPEPEAVAETEPEPDKPADDAGSTASEDEPPA
jgi:small subunit ribosomal protein S1